MIQGIPGWESELWSHISSGDGVNCPLCARCLSRQRGEWCSSDNKEHIARLLDDTQFDFRNYNFIEHRAPCRILRLVAKLAHNYLKIARVCHAPVTTELIRLFDKQHAVEVREVPLKAYHGSIWRVRDGWVIQLRKDDTSARKRYTLFHEAFHILAHCRTGPVFSKRGLERGSFNELLADYFAACVTIPREWAIERWRRDRDLGRLAEIFDIPEQVMWIRLRELGLV